MIKKYICISVKHTYHQKRGLWLWGHNKSGYVGESWKAGLYTEKDFDYDYARYPVVKMRKDLARFYHKKYDSVLVDKDEFIKFTNEKQPTPQIEVKTMQKEIFMQMFNLLQEIRKQSDKTLGVFKQLIDPTVAFYLPLLPFNEIESQWVSSMAKILNTSKEHIEWVLYENNFSFDDVKIEEAYNELVKQING